METEFINRCIIMFWWEKLGLSVIDFSFVAETDSNYYDWFKRPKHMVIRDVECMLFIAWQYRGFR